MGITKPFQEQVKATLKLRLNRQDVEAPWPAFSGYQRRIYQPLVDIAVGPFATGNQRYEDQYDAMVDNLNRLVDKWIKMFIENWETIIGSHHWGLPPLSPSSYHDFKGVASNENARCFIAIEIENQNSRKHLMGSIVNAGALGRLGLLVAWNDEALRVAIRMREYFDFLQSVGKRTFNMNNVIVLTSAQLADSLGIFSRTKG